jgi:hypothetical protein
MALEAITPSAGYHAASSREIREIREDWPAAGGAGKMP